MTGCLSFIVFYIAFAWALPAGYCSLMGLDCVCLRRPPARKDGVVLLLLTLLALGLTLLLCRLGSM